MIKRDKIIDWFSSTAVNVVIEMDRKWDKSYYLFEKQFDIQNILGNCFGSYTS